MWKKKLLGFAALGLLLAAGYTGYDAALAQGAVVAQEASTPYAVVDTGQMLCYDVQDQIACPGEGQAFFGQDAQYAGNQPSYTLSADGLTVYDNVTGLTWTQSPDLNGDGNIDADDKLTSAEAQVYVDTLNAQNFGGYDDWRLPSIKELYSLIDFRGTDPPPEGTNTTGLIPFIDTDYFAFAYGDTTAGERIIDVQFLSSTEYVGQVFNGQSAIFGVNFADGRIKGYPASKDQYIFLCRGNTDYGQNDFVDNGDGTITDNATGLMWSQADSGRGMNWEDALAWVEQMNEQNYLGYDDWRLPDVKELESIVDYDRSPDTTQSAAIDPLFDTTQITNEAGQVDYAYYWSSTTHLRAGNSASASAAAYVSFGRGLGSMDGTHVIDVHGAGAQRSDPKDGNTANYPRWGGGPQGDVQRVFNYVRLVRDAEPGAEQVQATYLPFVESNSDTPAASAAADVAGAQQPPGANAADQAGPPDAPSPAGNQPSPAGQSPADTQGQRPDLAAAAQKLGVSLEALRAALGEPGQGPPDLVAAAAQLNVSVEALQEALGLPGGGPPAGQPPGS